MAITTALSNAFKLELLKGKHDLDNHEIRVALIKENPTGTYDATTLAYSELDTNSDHPSGTGYTATFDSITTGARALIASDDVGGTNTQYPKMSGTTAILDFDDAVFTNVTVQADGCILYNKDADSAANVIAVFDFGGTVSATAGDFTIQFPAPGASTSILRLA
jgi:hypothetical protein